MVRKAHLAAFFCILALAGCGRGGNSSAMLERVAAQNNAAPPPPDSAGTDRTSAAQQQFSYTHSWNLILSHAALPRHFEAARDACLKDKALDCRLISANLSTDADSATAQLSVLLPHASLDRFEHLLRDPRMGEKPDEVRLASRSTHAESVENAAADSNRKVAQLTAYRDRLAAITKRPNLSVDDLIKLEAEQARVEGDLDAAVAEQRGIESGLAREEVDVSLWEQAPPPPSALAAAWSDAGRTLGDSTASMILFVIGALPWLPLIAAGLWALVRLVRLAWRRKPRVNIAVAAGDPLAKPAVG